MTREQSRRCVAIAREAVFLSSDLPCFAAALANLEHQVRCDEANKSDDQDGS
jgi:hypothetical protein